MRDFSSLVICEPFHRNGVLWARRRRSYKRMRGRHPRLEGLVVFTGPVPLRGIHSRPALRHSNDYRHTAFLNVFFYTEPHHVIDNK
jgi:hypothetical protein